MTIKRVLIAYVIAPAGAAVVASAIMLYGAITGRSISGIVNFGPAVVATAVVMAYMVGLMMLPAFWFFEKAGWRGWRCYVSVATIAGPVANYLMLGGAHRPWQFYIVCAAAGAACASLFSIILAWQGSAKRPSMA